MESDGDVGRLEAVVIATGPTMVRLVTRSGRRITFPSGRWEVAWSFVHPPPAEPRLCSHCRQAAFFRHTVGGDIAWVCEDHVPHGARAYFPGDAPGPPTVGLSCPRCESTTVEVDAKLIELAGTRTTTRSTCGRCRCSWATLVGRGLGDDGTVLAGDLTRLIQEDPSASEVWLGFVAYRNLCRAICMGDVAHIHGVTLHSKPALADALTVVFFGTDTELVRATTTSERPPAFGAQFPSDGEIPIGSLWKRRRSDWGRELTCRVVSDDNRHHVTLRVLARRAEDMQPVVTLPVETFHLYWTPNVPLTECPRPWTVWQHIETGQVVQVTPGTPTQAANHQVSYFTADGLRETTPVVTFYRLHHELPAPPQGHIWCRDGSLFVAQLTDGGVTVHPYAVHEPSSHISPRAVTFAEFYSQYVPLVFEDELIVYDQEVFVQRDTRWTLKANPDVAAFIVDVGRARHASDYVRFNNDAGLHVQELLSFLSEYELPPRAIPCQVGETWVGLEDPKREVTIARVDPAFGKVVIRWESDVSTTLNVEELVTQFRKLDVRSYWEILDSDEGP